MVSAQLAGPVFGSTAELLLWLVGGAVLIFGGLVLTVWGAVRAASRGDILWLVGIVAGFFVGFSWLVAIVYLLTTRNGSERVPTCGTPTDVRMPVAREPQKPRRPAPRRKVRPEGGSDGVPGTSTSADAT